MSVRRIGVSRRDRPWDRLIGSTLLTHQLQDAPFIAWPMQENIQGSTIFDASGNGWNGSIYGNNGTWAMAQSPLIHASGYSLRLMGGSGADTALGPPTGSQAEMTIEGVFKRTALADSNPYFVTADSNYGTHPVFGLIAGTTYSAYSLHYGQATVYPIPAINVIMHMAGTHKYPGKDRIYINGTLVAESPATAVTPSSGVKMHIGTHSTGTNSADYYGYMAYLAAYNRELSGDDILRHAKAAGLA